MIPEEKIAEVRERVDLLALVGEHVALRKAGRSYLGLCPFHSEKTPSFHVNQERGFYHCFGCQESGDAIAFVRQLEGLSFVEAVRQLANRLGIELPEHAPSRSSASARVKERLLKLLEEATCFFQERLSELPPEAKARQELARRGVGDAIIDAFRLGYAPDDWHLTTDAMRSQGYSEEECERAGLGQHSKSGERFYDRFRGRLMFPITNVVGQVIAFSGRHIPERDEPGQSTTAVKVPKYINSPEGLLYTKGHTLFGIAQAKRAMQSEDCALLCEGNFDVLALHQAGLGHAVAPLGTALTQQQVQLLRRYASKVNLVFDGDAAGRKAMLLADATLREAGLSACVVALPEGEDPDSFIRRLGRDELVAKVKQAAPLLTWIIDKTAAETSPDPTARAQAISSLRPFFSQVKNPVELRLYLERVATRFQIEHLDTIARALEVGQAISSRRPPGVASNRKKPGQRRESASRSATRMEAELVGLLLDVPCLISSNHAEKLEKLLTSSAVRSILHELKLLYRDLGVIDSATLIARFEGTPSCGWLKKRMSLQKYGEDDAEDTLRRGVGMLARTRAEEELPRLAQEIQQALRSGNEELASSLRVQHVELARQAHHMTKALVKE